ncbi:MAG TPA: hypothetical protein VGM23_01065 [Armatimonadota bacterium]|jgi:hypothetical protein
MRYPLRFRFILALLIGAVMIGSGFILARTGLSRQVLIAIAVFAGVLFGLINSWHSVLRYTKFAQLLRHIIIDAFLTGAAVLDLIITIHERAFLFCFTALWTFALYNIFDLKRSTSRKPVPSSKCE